MAKWYSGLKIYLLYGQKGSGKSIFTSSLALKLIRSYYRIEKRYPNLPKRKLYINLKFSKAFEDLELGKHFEYWSNPRELYNVRNADIIWDEIGKDLPTGSWADTSKNLKQVFSHLRKRGNRLFANTQLFEDVDISFRRQVDKAFMIRKVMGSRDISATLPPPRRIWGLIVVRQFDPMLLEHEHDQNKRISMGGFPKLLFIRKKLVDLYDTTSELPPYLPDKLDERVLTCIKGSNCTDHDHKGRPYTKVIHTII